MHPRIAVSGLCLPELSAVEAIEAVAEIGVRNTSMLATKLREAGADAVAAAGRRCDVKTTAVATSPGFGVSASEPLAGQLEQARMDIDLASAVGASSLYALTGRRAAWLWNDCANAFVDSVGQLAEYASAQNVVLAIEPVNWLYADRTFVHSFHDAVVLASRANLQVCLDLFHVWMERELREDIAQYGDLIAHVQVGDYAFGDRALPSRAVPGDGGVPIAQIVRWLLEAGYEGPFDCEVNGPRIDAIGHREAASRAATWLDALLSELAA
jgi:sugar phosphate isomerase/epimerase